MKKVLGFLSAVLLLSSCSLVQESTFNEDNIGNMSVYSDMSDMVDQMGGSMPSKTKDKVNVFNKPNEELDSLTMMEYVGQADGITNVLGIDNNNLYHYGMKFDFKDVKAVNSALNRMKYFYAIKKDSTAVLESFDFYTVDAKQATIKEPLSKKEAGSEDSAGADKMAKMLTMTWTVSFDGRKISKIESEADASKKGKNKIIVNLGGDKISARTTETIATVKFK